MSDKNSDFEVLCDYLRDMANKTNAGRAYVDFTLENGDVFRVEYKPSKKRDHERV